MWYSGIGLTRGIFMVFRLFLLGIVLLGCNARGAIAGTLGTPNIIFVLFDDIGLANPQAIELKVRFEHQTWPARSGRHAFY